MRMINPPYIQCACPKHGPTTLLHADREADDWCLLPTRPATDAEFAAASAEAKANAA